MHITNKQSLYFRTKRYVTARGSGVGKPNLLMHRGAGERIPTGWAVSRLRRNGYPLALPSQSLPREGSQGTDHLTWLLVVGWCRETRAVAFGVHRDQQTKEQPSKISSKTPPFWHSDGVLSPSQQCIPSPSHLGVPL